MHLPPTFRGPVPSIGSRLSSVLRARALAVAELSGHGGGPTFSFLSLLLIRAPAKSNEVHPPLGPDTQASAPCRGQGPRPGVCGPAARPGPEARGPGRATSLWPMRETIAFVAADKHDCADSDQQCGDVGDMAVIAAPASSTPLQARPQPWRAVRLSPSSLPCCLAAGRGRRYRLRALGASLRCGA